MTDLPVLTKTRFPTLAMVAITLGLGGLASQALSTDRDLSASFESAVGAKSKANGAVRAADAGPPVVGNEAFWLGFSRKAAPVEPAAFAPRTTALAPGDRFELKGETGRRTLEVVEVRAFAGAALGTAESAKPQLLVSLRVLDSKSDLVRLIVDADAPLAGLAPLGRGERLL